MSNPDDPRPMVDAPPEPDPITTAPVVSVPPTPTSPASSPDFLDTLDRSLDPEEADRRTIQRMKNPFIRWVIISLLVLLFGLFGIYAAAFIFRIPIPEPEVLKTFINAVVSIMKMFSP